jgi:hypothetical protein
MAPAWSSRTVDCMFRRVPAPSLPAAAPAGPGWVYAVIPWRTFRHRLGFALQDLALHAEGSVLVLWSGWSFVGRHRYPLLVVIAEGWIPRPARLHAAQARR